MKTKLVRVLSAVVTCALCACSGADETTASPHTGEATAEAADEAPASDALSLDEQIELIEQRIAATNGHDWELWESLHTPDAIRTAPELAEPLQGAAAMRAAIEALSAAFPDYHLELRQAFGQGEWLAVRIHTDGTMTGPLTLADGEQLPPTGQPIVQDWAALVRFEGDRIAEFHEFYDQLALLMQLGLVEL